MLPPEDRLQGADLKRWLLAKPQAQSVIIKFSRP